MKCRFEHDGDCCNSGATQYMCKCKKPCDTIMPITNADRIRAMSDEELLHWLLCLQDDAIKRFANFELPNYQGLADWLKQPAESEGSQ